MHTQGFKLVTEGGYLSEAAIMEDCMSCYSERRSLPNKVVLKALLSFFK